MTEHWSEKIPKDACEEAVDWARTQPTLAAAWAKCTRGDWMLWLLAQGTKQGSEHHKRLVLCACACARLSLEYVPIGEERPRKAIEAAERWARGEATIEEVRAAADNVCWAAAYRAQAAALSAQIAADSAWAAADSSARAVADSARAAANSAKAAAYSAEAAIYSAETAAYSSAGAVADIARTVTLKQCADIVRTYFTAKAAMGKE